MPVVRAADGPSLGRLPASGLRQEGVALIVEITSPRQYRNWQAHTLPPVERVRDGLWSVPVPMPGNGMWYELCYVLELPDGLAVIDPGGPDDRAWQALAGGLASIGYRLEDVRAVLASHVHIDHYGLAGRVREVSGAWLALHPADTALLMIDDDEFGQRQAAWQDQRRRMGMPPPRRAGPRAKQPARAQLAYVVQPDVLINDGDLVDLPGWRLRAVWTPGHSPGHLCFHEENLGLLFGGDHLLPESPPRVSATSRQRPNPLRDFLSSLAVVSELDATEVLPAHEYRYAGLGERAAELVSYHTARMAEIEDSLSSHPGATCWQLAQGLSWSRPLDSQPAALRRAAASGTLSHLVLLQEQDRAYATGEEPQRWYVGPVRPVTRAAAGHQPSV
jgi:glyoxylase-like metal-dependent hydrolase (beta-lactamase superfamily II)